MLVAKQGQVDAKVDAAAVDRAEGDAAGRGD